ncbi:MAG: hypothetical protein GWP47_09190 [Actinobacteria bacterium]|jgi:hypothetical protein|nr:hypothetical protein [Actinomycetota bacterium]
MPSDSAIFITEGATCAQVADLLVGIDEVELLGFAARTHVEQCLRCQAEAASYRRLRRTMRSLAAEPASVDSMLEHEIMVALDVEDGRVVSRVPRGAAAVATLGGLAAAAGAIAIATRRRAS